MKVTVGAICAAVVDWVSEAAEWLVSAAQLAVRLHAPVPLIMVTALPAIEQAPLAVITAVVLALVVAVTVNVD